MSLPKTLGTIHFAVKLNEVRGVQLETFRSVEVRKRFQGCRERKYGITKVINLTIIKQVN
jgi:hypothetical protein